MIVRFGLGFDDGVPETPETSIGRVTVGPAGLISIVETQLGIVTPRNSHAKRLVQYRACLAKLNTFKRFYHQSFLADPFGVSKTLLWWRDQWYLAGWDGTFPEGVGKRLKDMADVERLARNEVAAGEGQRLQAVLKALESRNTQIECIEIVDTLSDHPLLWQRGLSCFKTIELKVDGQGPRLKNSSDLGRLQQTLWTLNQKEGAKPREIKLADDGSVAVLTARSREVSARFLAEYLQVQAGKRDVLVICGDKGAALDRALSSVDAAHCGFSSPARSRPALQLVALALSLIWNPPDPYALQQFLVSPVGPLPARARRRLAGALLEAPGVGGRPWRLARQRIEEHERKERKAGETEVQRLLDRIDFWVECPRFDPEKGAPLAVIQERCAAVASWLAGMRHVEEDPAARVLYTEAYSRASELSDALDMLASSGAESMGRISLEKFVDEVIGAGAGLADGPAELGHPAACRFAASVVRPVDEVVWWDFSMPVLPSPYPWTRVELADLLRSRVELQSLEARLAHTARTWLRPVMAAGRRIVFVIHLSDEEHHPLWDQVKSCLKEIPELDLEEAIQSGRKLSGFPVEGTGLGFKPLPTVKRWWRLSDGRLLGPREVESFSGLDDFIKSPYKWVLKYKALLEPGRLANLPSGNQLYGTLAHRLLEDFFEKHPDWQKLGGKELNDWLETRTPVLIEQEGAVLLMPGRGVERERFKSTTRDAFSTLMEGLRAAKAKTVQVESKVNCNFMDGELTGRIDLLLKDQAGRDMVLDVKWSGAKYREKELRQNLHLQLAVYSWLRKSLTGSTQWPPQAFFIVDKARFLTQDQVSFPAAIPCPSRDGETTPDLWRRIEITWKWRRKQLSQGLIEITVKGAEPDDGSEPPEDGMKLEDRADRFNDYAVLTGWTEGA